ncbi:hypothetical protein TNCV_202031 [Trichonephila clavipes]|nr:hypothetical protein TNCV_202031 [Trichonephila clavipes]
MWDYVKSLVYADEPQTLDHLEDNIRRVIADRRPQMLEKVIENWTSRLDYIRASVAVICQKSYLKYQPLVSIEFLGFSSILWLGWILVDYQEDLIDFMALQEQSLSVPSFLYVSDSPLVSMDVPLRTAYSQAGRLWQPKPAVFFAQAQLETRTETVETFELVKVEPKLLRGERRTRGARAGVTFCISYRQTYLLK